MKHLFLLAGLVFVTTTVSAEVYKWVDAEGQTHYSDRPAAAENTVEHVPMSADSKPDAVTTTTDERQRLQRQKHLLDVLQQERSRKQEAKDRAEEERKKAQANCEHARKRLADAQSAGYLYRKGKDGERIIFSDSERTQATAAAAAEVKKWCQH